MYWVIALIVLLVLIKLLRRRTRQKRIAFIRHYNYQKLLTSKLRQQLSYLNEAQLTQALAALSQYFVICYKARKRLVSMPSQLVDDIWHEFILNTRAYHDFCKKAFGRYLHHLPAEAMAMPQAAQLGIKRAWRLACAEESINARLPTRLPLLFAIDGLYQIPNGFYYQLNCSQAQRHGRDSGSPIYCASDVGCGGGCGSYSDGCGGDGGSSDSGCSGGCGGGGD